MGIKKVEELMIGEPKEGDCCPECKTSWDGGDILEELVRLKDEGMGYQDYSDEDLIKAAGDYGWTSENKKRFGNLIGMELSMDDPEHYDGVSYWACPECGVAWCRWTGERTERFVKAITERNRRIDEMNGKSEFPSFTKDNDAKINDNIKKHI